VQVLLTLYGCCSHSTGSMARYIVPALMAGGAVLCACVWTATHARADRLEEPVQ